MKDVYLVIASLSLVAALFVFLGTHSRPRLVVAAAPAVVRPVVLEPPTPKARLVAADHWLVTLPTTADWYDSGIPAAVGFQIWAEPETPVKDCQFLLRLGGEMYSSEVVENAGAPTTQRILIQLDWREVPAESLARVDTLKLRLAASCRRSELELNVQVTNELSPDDPLFQQEEYEDQRQKVLAAHRLAEELRRLFEPLPQKR